MCARRLHGWTIAFATLTAVSVAGLEGVWSQDKKTPPTESSDPYFSANLSTLPNPLPLKRNPIPDAVRRHAAQPPAIAPKPQPLGDVTPPQSSDRRPLLPLHDATGQGTASANIPSMENLAVDKTTPLPKLEGTSPFRLPDVKPPDLNNKPNSSTNQQVVQASGEENKPTDIKKFELPVLERAFTPEPPESATIEPTANDVANEVFEAGRVLVIVGSRPILVGDLLQEVNELIEKHAARAPEEQKKVQRQMLLQRLLPKFIDRQLVYADAVRELPDGAAIEQINESLGKAFDEEALPKILEASKLDTSLQFDAQLRAMGSSLRQFRQSWIDDQFVRYSLSQKMKDEKEEVSYQEMKDYYDQHLSEYEFPAKVRWEQLLIRFDRIPDRTAARNKIAEIGNEVVSGAPLSAVAQRSSHDYKASEGGMQGWTTQGSLAAESLEKILFEMPLNQLSDVIETSVGYHIVRVLERTPAGAMPFKDAQVEIKEKLLTAKQEKRFEDYMKKLRSEIPIEVVDRSVQLPDQYLVR